MISVNCTFFVILFFMGKNRFKNRVHNERTRFYWYGEIYSFFEIIKSASLKEKSSLSWRKRMLTFAFNSLSSKVFVSALISSKV